MTIRKGILNVTYYKETQTSFLYIGLFLGLTINFLLKGSTIISLFVTNDNLIRSIEKVNLKMNIYSFLYSFNDFIIIL